MGKVLGFVAGRVRIYIQIPLRFKMLNLFNLSEFKVKAGFASADEYDSVNVKITTSIKTFFLNQIIVRKIDVSYRLQIHKAS